MFADFLILCGLILLGAACLAGLAELWERRESRELSRRFRENQRLRRGSY